MNISKAAVCRTKTETMEMPEPTEEERPAVEFLLGVIERANQRIENQSQSGKGNQITIRKKNHQIGQLDRRIHQLQTFLREEGYSEAEIEEVGML
jgi:hypothetical protein